MFRRRLVMTTDTRPALSDSSYYHRLMMEDTTRCWVCAKGELALEGQDIASISNGTSLQRFWNRGRR